jgi:hypothetical protein
LFFKRKNSEFESIFQPPPFVVKPELLLQNLPPLCDPSNRAVEGLPAELVSYTLCGANIEIPAVMASRIDETSAKR